MIDFLVLPARTSTVSGAQVAFSRKTALCSTPSAPNTKPVNALWMTICWPATPGLGEVDRRSRVFGREVLVAREDEVEHDAGRGVAVRRAASRRVDERRSADEIVGQLAGALEKNVGLDVDDLEFRSLAAAGQHHSSGRNGDAKPVHVPLRSPRDSLRFG